MSVFGAIEQGLKSIGNLFKRKDKNDRKNAIIEYKKASHELSNILNMYSYKGKNPKKSAAFIIHKAAKNHLKCSERLYKEFIEKLSEQ